MRGAFVKTLLSLAEEDERIVLLTGDLGYMVMEPFAEKFPTRFINAGVAEQNMVGLATGLAEAGLIPFVYSIVTFASLRPYEFIRNGPILHHLPVRIAGVGGGFEYGHNGVTHFGLEDAGIMRVQPGISVMAPADYQQTETVLRKSWQLAGPVYYRLGKDDKTVVPGLDGRFDVGRLQIIREGADVGLIAMGGMAAPVMAAAGLLVAHGIEASVAVLASISPAPVDDLEVFLGKHRVVLTAEAHYISGAAGSLVAEVIAERGVPCKLVRCGVDRVPAGITGSQKFMEAAFGLSPEALAERAEQAVRDVNTSVAVN
jgi:transketolase